MGDPFEMPLLFIARKVQVECAPGYRSAKTPLTLERDVVVAMLCIISKIFYFFCRFGVKSFSIGKT